MHGGMALSDASGRKLEVGLATGNVQVSTFVPRLAYEQLSQLVTFRCICLSHD
jgi:hypothetical protein